MAGNFAKWQPAYAEYGIATYPLTADRTPAISNYSRVGLRGSQQLALKFAANDAFGFMCGRRNGVTVLDVDTPDERVLADMLDTFGPTPIIVRSGSGRWHAWYRHNGEGRQTPLWPNKPVDLLGAGMAVAPPSKAANGNYQFVQGSLEDVDRLPTMRPMQAKPDEPGQATERIRHGSRSKELLSHLLHQAHDCDTYEQLEDVAFTFVEQRIDRVAGHRFTDADIRKAASYAWQKTVAGENWVRQGRVQVPHAIVDQMAAAHPDAFALYNILLRNHAKRSRFALPKSFAEHLGWTPGRFKQARGKLEEHGLVRCISRGGRGPKDPPQYALC